ncbi:carbon-nitrogen hydrolase family protein [Paracoccaceae bacterium GXU_MW_L88]
MQPLRIALLQTTPQSSPAAALATLEQSARQAAKDGAKLLITPEMFLTGYNIGAEKTADLAEPVDGTLLHEVSVIARSSGIAILTGWPEKDGAIYNSIALIGADGKRIGTARKTHLFGDVDAAQFTPGDTFAPLIDFQGWRLGLAICYDIEFPETARHFMLEGADAILVPTANMSPFEMVPTQMLPTRAAENTLYIAYANYVGKEGGFSYCGLSCVSGPDGVDFTRGNTRSELLFATLSPDYLTKTRAAQNQRLQRRPTLYRNLTEETE